MAHRFSSSTKPSSCCQRHGACSSSPPFVCFPQLQVITVINISRSVITAGKIPPSMFPKKGNQPPLLHKAHECQQLRLGTLAHCPDKIMHRSETACLMIKPHNLEHSPRCRHQGGFLMDSESAGKTGILFPFRTVIPPCPTRIKDAFISGSKRGGGNPPLLQLLPEHMPFKQDNGFSRCPKTIAAAGLHLMDSPEAGDIRPQPFRRSRKITICQSQCFHDYEWLMVTYLLSEAIRFDAESTNT